MESEIGPTEISNTEKLGITEYAMQIAADSSTIIVSGSVARKIAEKIIDGKCSLEPNDLNSIHDVDLISTNFNDSQLAISKLNGTQRNGFNVEIDYGGEQCLYDQEKKRLAVSTAIIIIGNKEITVRYSTPAYLLLSLVQQETTEKTPPEKYRRKVLGLQQATGFSREDFLTLAKYEIKERDRLCREVFKLWRSNTQSRLTDKQVFSDLLASTLDELPSTIDKSKLINIMRIPEDFDALDYNDLRIITPLERFVLGIDDEIVSG